MHDGPRGGACALTECWQSGQWPMRRSRRNWSCCCTSGNVHRTLLRGEKRSMEREESMRHHAERGVMVETSPAQAFEVVQPHFPLHLLVVPFHSPAQLGQAHQLL